MDYLTSLLVFLCALTDRIFAIISMTFPIGSLHFSYCCLRCIGILAMEKRFDSLSAFLYLVFWQWKNKLISCLHFCIGIMEWKNVFFCYSCLRCISILAMEKRFDSLSTFLYLVSWKWKNVFCVIHVCIVLVSWQWKNKIISLLAFL
jgi:hypothetical protein